MLKGFYLATTGVMVFRIIFIMFEKGDFAGFGSFSGQLNKPSVFKIFLKAGTITVMSQISYDVRGRTGKFDSF